MRFFIGEWSDSNHCHIIRIIQWFFLASGLRTNLKECRILIIGVRFEEVELVVSVSNCGIFYGKVYVELIFTLFWHSCGMLYGSLKFFE